MKITKIFKVIVGQDLVEYALMAGFVAVAAGAIIPEIAKNLEYIFKKIECSQNNQDVLERPSAGSIGGYRFECVAQVSNDGGPR